MEKNKHMFVRMILMSAAVLHIGAAIWIYFSPMLAAVYMDWLFPMSVDSHPQFGHVFAAAGVYALAIGLVLFVAALDPLVNIAVIDLSIVIFYALFAHRLWTLNHINSGLELKGISEWLPHLFTVVLASLMLVFRPWGAVNTAQSGGVYGLFRSSGNRLGQSTAMFMAGLSDRLPGLRKWFWRKWYNRLSKNKDFPEDYTFMNYGHHELDDAREKMRKEAFEQLLLENLSDKQANMARLYFFVSERFKNGWEDAEILEVGSGRGGGARLIAQNYPILNYLGVDLSKTAIDFCREVHQNVKRLSFEVGDAEDLPLEDESKNVIINIESSHCYPNFLKFCKEVFRVLTPDGYFLFADFRTDRMQDELELGFEDAGFECVHKEEITENVIQALRDDSGHRRELIKSLCPNSMQGLMQTYAGVEGTGVYKQMQNGEMRYFFFVLRKPVLA